MPSKRSRGGRSRPASARAKRRQGHPAKQAEARRRDEEAARERARRAASPWVGGDAPSYDRDDGADPSRLAEGIAHRLRDVVFGITDPLEAAVVGSQMCEPWAADVAAGEDDPEAVLGTGLVRRTAEHGDATALAVLRALEIGATERTARAAASAAEDLVAAGHGDPWWYAATQGLAPVAAAVLHEDALDDGWTVLLEFAGPAHGAHTIGVHVDRNLDRLATDLVVGPSLEALAEEWADEPDEPGSRGLRLERVDVEAARAQAVVAIGRALVTPNRPFSVNVRPLWGIVMQRLGLIPGEVPPEAVEYRPAAVPEDERRRIVDAFFASADAPARDDVAETIARAAVDYAADRTGGDPLRWSPKVVGLFRIERIDEDPSLPPGVRERVPEVLGAWVAFAAAERGLSAYWTAEALAVVEEGR